MAANDHIKALTFDVFGTVVDYRGTIIREGEQINRDKGLAVDWGRLADEWRGGYGPILRRVERGELPWQKLDALHRMLLDDLIPRHGLETLTEAEREHINRVWHRLQPWPDAVPGLERLRSRYVIAPLSNGNLALLTNMAKHAGLPWDCILSAELAYAYKPNPAVYRMAADLLDLPPDQIMMVAAHQGDLRAAQAVGFRTAFVPRPLEQGPDAQLDSTPDPSFDFVAQDFAELAQQLGA